MSAISSVHKFIDNLPIGKHSVVVQFFKGLANLRPSQPRYSVTWDVEIVIKYLRSLWPLKKLDLKIVFIQISHLICFGNC